MTDEQKCIKAVIQLVAPYFPGLIIPDGSNYKVRANLRSDQQLEIVIEVETCPARPLVQAILQS